MKARIKATNKIVEVLSAEVYASGEYKAFYLNIPTPLNKFKPDEIELIDDYIMDYEKKYKNLVEAVKVLQETNPSDEGIQNWINDNIPELKVSDDERIRYEIIAFVEQSIHRGGGTPIQQEKEERWISWLEKQGKPIDNIVKRAMTEKQRVLLTEINGDANIDWDTRSLKDAITLLKHGLNYLQEIEVKKQTMPSSRFGGCSEYDPTRFDKEKQGKQGEQNLPSFDESQGTPILKQGEQKNAFSGYLKNYQKKINDMI